MYYIGIKFSTECEMQVQGGKKSVRFPQLKFFFFSKIPSLQHVKRPTIAHLRNGFSLETNRNLLEAEDNHPISEVENEWKKTAIDSRHTYKPNPLPKGNLHQLLLHFSNHFHMDILGEIKGFHIIAKI